MGYLFAGFLLLWALTFAYVFSISSRQRRLEQAISALEATANEPDDRSD